MVRRSGHVSATNGERLAGAPRLSPRATRPPPARSRWPRAATASARSAGVRDLARRRGMRAACISRVTLST